MKKGIELFRISIPIALGLVWIPLSELQAQTLEDAVGSAMAGNPRILAAVNDHLAWGQRIDQAFSGFLPRVDVNAGTGREWTSSPTTRAIEGGYALDRGELGVSVRQSLFEGFNTVHSLKQAKAKTRSAEAGLQETTLAVVLEAIEVYLETLKQGELLKVNEEAVATHEQIVAKMEELKDIGVGTDIETNQSRSRLVMARSEQEGTVRKLKEAEARFQEVIGRPPENLTLPMVGLSLLPKSLDEANRLALAHAPALQGSEANLDAAVAEKKMAVSNLLPRLNLEMDLGNNANVSGTRSYTKSASAMLQLQYNLFQGGNDWARHRETTRRVDQSQEELEQERRRIIKDVAASWHEVMNAVRQVPLMEKNLLVQERVALGYQEEEALGTRSHLDALNALNDVFIARRSLIEERYKQVLSACKLFSNMGLLTEVIHRFSQELPAVATSRSMNMATMVAQVREKQGQPLPWTTPWTSDEDSTIPSWNGQAENALIDYVGQIEKNENPIVLPFSIQVGGVMEESSSDPLVERLTGLGYEVFVQESRDSQGRIWHLVWAGSYSSRQEAAAALKKLQEKESIPAFVTATAIPPSGTHLSLTRITPERESRATDTMEEAVFLGMIQDSALGTSGASDRHSRNGLPREPGR
ncbi:MAG: TolC family outer membrane protein [Magnetococcales bacterium]|nr:TolC family outer membrane protein [Magnetococcales bacterium]